MRRDVLVSLTPPADSAHPIAVTALLPLQPPRLTMNFPAPERSSKHPGEEANMN